MKIKASCMQFILGGQGRILGKSHLIRSRNDKKELRKAKWSGRVIPNTRNKCKGPKIDANLMHSRHKKKPRAEK